jgi:hypothetical protein
MGRAHFKYDFDAWESVSEALARRMGQERDLND